MSDSPGILAVWNDRNPDIEAFYEDWYVNQHLRRVGLPGWRFGRRYEAMDGVTPQFFTYYETDAVADMFSDAYIARLNDPTPETVKVMQNWGNMTRTSCARHSMRGHCRGAFEWSRASTALRPLTRWNTSRCGRWTMAAR